MSSRLASAALGFVVVATAALCGAPSAAPDDPALTHGSAATQGRPAAATDPFAEAIARATERPGGPTPEATQTADAAASAQAPADTAYPDGSGIAPPTYLDVPGGRPSTGSTAIGLNEWRPADLAEVKRTVTAHRAAAGLPAFVTSFGLCLDRGGAWTATSFGILPGQTHGQNLVSNNSGVLRSAPTSGGVMAATFEGLSVTDSAGVHHPNQTVTARVYECGIPGAPPPGDKHNFTPEPSPTPPAPQPVPAPSPSSPPAPEPSPTPSSGEQDGIGG